MGLRKLLIISSVATLVTATGYIAYRKVSKKPLKPERGEVRDLEKKTRTGINKAEHLATDAIDTAADKTTSFVSKSARKARKAARRAAREIE